MLSADPYEQHVGARLLDFFGAVTPWHRRLWSTGVVLTLRELLEATEAVRAGVLTDASVRNLISSAAPVVGQDRGVGDATKLRVLQQSLRPEMRYGGIEFHKVRQIIEDLEGHYLERWAAALTTTASCPGPERTARAIASHLLDAGFDPDYLHRWWSYRIVHEPGVRSLAELVAEAHALYQQPPGEFEVIVTFGGAPLASAGGVANWLDATEVSTRLNDAGFDTSRLRQNGGLSVKVTARDYRAAVEAAAEAADRFTARVLIGTRHGVLSPGRDAWVLGEKTPIPLRRRGRGVEVHALERGRRLFVDGPPSSVDAAIELLIPMAASSPSPAVAGGWAAIEALLGTAGDERVLAGDRMAVMIACSFPRAELTALSYEVEKGGGAVAASLSRCRTNRDRAHELGAAIRRGDAMTLTDESDKAALARMQGVIADPLGKLEDIKNHASVALRRLYRHRNMVLHWGRTNAVALRASLRTAAPLVGEGMERIAHAWFVEGIAPLELAARASIRLSTVGSSGGADVVDLLD
jgi:hypothetical protein